METFVHKGGIWVAAQVVILVIFVFALSAGSDVAAPIVVAGRILAIGGSALALGGLVTLGPNLTPYPEPVERGRLVERGVYRVVRHPIYGGLCIAAIGLATARGSVLALLIAGGLLGFFRFKAHGEEQRLVATYPEYAGYQQRVRQMLIPLLI